MANIADNIRDLDKKKKPKAGTAEDILQNPLKIPAAPMTAAAVEENKDPALMQRALQEDEFKKWYDEQRKEISDKFEAKEKNVAKRQLIEKLAQAATQFGAALAGQKSGTDLANLKFVKQDFEKERDRLEGRRAMEMGAAERELGARRRFADLMAERKTRQQEKEEAQAIKRQAVDVQKAQQDLKKRMMDPDSEESKRLQEAAKKLAGKDFSGFSAQDIRSVLPNLISKKAEGKQLTEAQKQVDKEFAKDYSEFVAGGGVADARKQVEELKNVSTALEDIDTATGMFVGLVPKIVRDIVTPEGAALQDVVESVVQRNLREILGAQFTEKEGQRLIERAYNPRLDEAENKRRVDRLILQMQEALDAKLEAAEYYEKNGSLKGFKGKLYKSADEFLTEGQPAKVKEEKQPEAPSKIKVRNKQGQVGLIPASQLQEALKRGYTEVK